MGGKEKIKRGAALKRILIIIIVIAAVLSVPFLFLLDKNLAYYFYKELVYRTIVKNETALEKDPQKISFIFLDYFNSRLYCPYGSEVVDKDVYNDLLRGIAWCDQRAWGMATFLGKAGIENRMIMTRNPEGGSSHTVLEVYIDKKWRFFDPYFGIAVVNGNELVSYEDICKEPSLFYLHEDMLMLKYIWPEKYGEVKDYYTRNVFYKNHLEPSVWGNPASKKDLKRKVITSIADLFAYLFGNRFSYLYQDAYLARFSPSEKGESAYFRARNYDLLGRHRKSIDYYKNAINDIPKDSISEDALFFLGVAYNRMNNPESSIDAFNMLLKKDPGTRWRMLAYYYLGSDYELLKDYGSAEDNYRKSIDMYKALKELGIGPDEMRVVRKMSNILNKK